MSSFSRNEANNLKSNQIQCLRSISGVLKTASKAVKVASLSKRYSGTNLFISYLTCQEIMPLFKLCCLCPFHRLQHQFHRSCG